MPKPGDLLSFGIRRGDLVLHHTEIWIAVHRRKTQIGLCSLIDFVRHNCKSYKKLKSLVSRYDHYTHCTILHSCKPGSWYHYYPTYDLEILTRCIDLMPVLIQNMDLYKDYSRIWKLMKPGNSEFVTDVLMDAIRAVEDRAIAECYINEIHIENKLKNEFFI